MLRKESGRIKEKYKLNLRNGQEPSCPPSGAVVLHTNLTNYPLQNGKKLALLLYNLNNICLGSASTNDGGGCCCCDGVGAFDSVQNIFSFRKWIICP